VVEAGRAKADLALLVLGLALLTVATAAGVRTVHSLTAAWIRHDASLQNQRFTCLERRLRTLVPRGSQVAILTSPTSVELQQRLAEWSTGWATIVGAQDRPRLLLSVITSRSAPCAGMDVSAAAAR
jgi:hypothetical protein